MKHCTRILSAALALMLLFTGCSQNAGVSDVVDKVTSVVEDMAQSEAPSETPLESQEPTDSVEEPVQETAEPEGTDEFTNTEGSIAVPDSFTETVLVDNEHCKVTVTGFSNDYNGDAIMQLALENKTDVTLMFSMEFASVNGIMVDPFWADEVAAGKILNAEVSWYADELLDKGIDTLSTVEFRLRAYDSDNWDAEDALSEVLTVYPFGEDQAVTLHREAQDTDMVLYEDGNVRVIAIGYDPQGEYGNTVHMYIENMTDRNLTVTIDDCAVNGVMADPAWLEELAPGKASYSDLDWFLDSTLEELGITDITSMTGTLRAYDSDNWSADDVVNAPFTYEPQGAEAVSTYEYIPGEQDVILADNESFQFIVTGFEKDDLDYETMKVFIRNNTDRTLRFSAENVSINGYMCDPYWAVSVAPGKMAVSSFRWSDTDLASNGIENITDVEFSLEVRDDESFEEIAMEDYQVTAW